LHPFSDRNWEGKKTAPGTYETVNDLAEFGQKLPVNRYNADPLR
jgi:hypothetical protein